jgi:hypothetical protein
MIDLLSLIVAILEAVVATASLCVEVTELVLVFVRAGDETPALRRKKKKRPRK